MIRRAVSVVVALLSVCGCVNQPQLESKALTFAILGDNPYDPETYARYERLIEHVNDDSELAWVIHVGDFKGGVESCSEELLQARFDLNQEFTAPFVLTPGDNDWYDCIREGAGAFNDYERLERLRKIFYPAAGAAAVPGGRSQAENPEFAEVVENVIWHAEGVTFATLHMLGPTRPTTDQQAASRDVAAATAWLKTVFAEAADRNAKGVFIATQVDPWLFSGNRELADDFCPACVAPRTGIEWFYPLMTDLVQAFGKPVVLAVGDTHVFRVDKPLYHEGRLVENFTRLEVFGYPDVHWVKVSVDSKSPNVFTFEQRLVP